MAIDWDARVQALEEALASGVLRATYDGQTVEYRTQAELRQALQFAKGQQSGYSAAKPRPAFTATRGMVGE